MLHFQKPCCAILMLLVIFTCPACSPKSLMVVSSTSKCSISIGMSLLSGSLKVPCPFAFLETKTGNKAKRTHSQKHTQVHVALSRSMCYHHRASYLPELHALSDHGSKFKFKVLNLYWHVTALKVSHGYTVPRSMFRHSFRPMRSS